MNAKELVLQAEEHFYKVEEDAGSKDEAALAMILFTAALKEEPDNIEALNGRSLTFGFLRKPTEAAHDLEKLLELVPEDVEARERLAAAYKADGKTEDAIEQINYLLLRDMERPDYLLTRGKLLTSIGKHEEAIHDLAIAKTMADAELLPAILYTISSASLNMRNYAKAEEYARQSIELKPNRNVYTVLVSSLASQGKWDETVMEAEQAREKGFNGSVISGNLCFAYKQKGDLDRARQVGMQAVANKHDSAIWAYLGDIAMEQGNKAEAKIMYQQAHAEIPNVREISQLCGIIRAERGLKKLKATTKNLETELLKLQPELRPYLEEHFMYG